MMDLKEATSSLDHYASRLDLLFKNYEMTVAIAELEKNTQISSQSLLVLTPKRPWHWNKSTGKHAY
jgi:hypothetical protein